MKHLPLLLLLTLTSLTACALPQTGTDPASETPQASPSPAPVSNVTPTPTDDPALLATLFPNMNENSELSRVDEQGAVIVEVTPLNLGSPADTLQFDVSMNTHSVDLSMDLATLATLSTDAGVTVQAVKWDAVPGGHHVSGTLIFPAMNNGIFILAGASKLTLTITNVDAAARRFEWELQ